MLIYAGRIANLTDARYFAAREVRWLGFNLEPGTENYLDPIYMQSMREWVQGPEIIGEFTGGAMPVETIAEAARFFQLDGVLIGPDTPPASLTDIPLLLKIDENHRDFEQILRENTRFYQAIIIDLPLTDEATEARLAQLIASVAPATRLLLNSPAGHSDLARRIDAFQAAGLYLAGGEEERVGVKSFDELEGIFDWLEARSV